MIIYIYNLNLELIGCGDKARVESSIFIDYYVACGYILSSSKLDFAVDSK